MDIRSFFAPKTGGGGGKVGGKQVGAAVSDGLGKKKRANVISDSDEEEQRPVMSKKPVKKKSNALSDSDSAADDDQATKAKTRKKPKVGKDSNKAEVGIPKPKLKEVKASDFFNSASPQAQKSVSVKRKSPEKARYEKSHKLKTNCISCRDEVRDQLFDEMVDKTPFSPAKKQRTKSPDTATKLSQFKYNKPGSSQVESEALDVSKSCGGGEQSKPLLTPPSPSKLQQGANEESSPAGGSLDDSTIPNTPQAEHEAKKAARSAAYKKYVARGGARNPGSKEVPAGSPDCLAGNVFVLTGVYDSLEREELAGLIKRLGGRVTSSLSKNTTHLVVGEEAGESKLAKAKTLGTSQLTEDQFLDLLKSKTVIKQKENTTPKVSPEKLNEKSVVKVERSREKTPKKLTSNKSMEVEQDKIRSPKIPKIKTCSQNNETAKEETEPKSQPQSTGFEETELLVDKYKPSNCKNIIGQQGDRSNMNKLKVWLRDWNSHHLQPGGKKAAAKPAPWGNASDTGAWAKCALLSGPPGVGKTTTAYLVSKELGFDVVEMNASDTRSKRQLGESVADTLNTTSVAGLAGRTSGQVTSKRVLLMDEVDGMAGNEDRGGVAELIALIKSSKVPVVAMCNDRNHQKIRSLANHCFDLRFSRPRVEQIKAAMMSVCFKEKIPIKPDALSELITGCGQDVRQVLHHLTMVRAGGMEGGAKMEAGQARREAEASKKTSIKVGPWDVCRKVFSSEDHKTMSLYDKSDLFFYDYNLAGLFVQEVSVALYEACCMLLLCLQNYLAAKPAAAGGDRKKLMELVSRAAGSIAQGDLVEARVRSGQNWGLLPTAAHFCSVLPGEYMSGRGRLVGCNAAYES